MKRFLLPVAITAITIFCNCTNGPKPDDTPAPTTPVLSYSITNTLPHDTSFFTEGLEFYKGQLLESTGLENESKLVLYNPTSGVATQRLDLPAAEFGEGVSVLRDTVYQLTYQTGKVLVYSVAGFKKLKELPFKGEGWGLTNDSVNLIASNGSNNLYYYEPGTFKLLKTVAVTENGVPSVNINELEYMNGFVYANQWQMNYILKINPATGAVVGKMDLSEMAKRVRNQNPAADVLNGIAFNPQNGKVYITGKKWPQIFEMQFGN